jgi:VWFA-related protein
MTTQRFVCLAALLCWPLLAVAQEPGAAAGTAAQTVPAPVPAPPGPVLVNRPPPGPVRPSSAVTPEGRIHLDLVVSDAAGKTALGLGPSDFKLLDDNQPRRILSFRSFDGVAVKANPPVEVILVFDTVNLPFTQVSFVHQELARFLSQNGGHLSQPVSIMLLTDAGLRVQPRLSVDGSALLSVLDQVKGEVHTIYGAMGADGQLQRLQLSLRQMTAIAENEARKPGRKLLIWVGPGWPMLTSNNFSFSDKDQRRYFDAIVELSTRLREARMVVYSAAAENVENPGEPPLLYQGFLKGVTSARKADTGNLALRVLVAQSGGLVLGPDNDVVSQIDRCVADAGAFYTVSFDPPRAEHADEYHDLKVQVAQAGLIVRTSTGYYNQPPPAPITPN